MDSRIQYVCKNHCVPDGETAVNKPRSRTSLHGGEVTRVVHDARTAKSQDKTLVQRSFPFKFHCCEFWNFRPAILKVT